MNRFISLVISLFLSLFCGCLDSTEKDLLENFYPLDFCIVTGSDLGDMGEPVSYEHNGTLIKFCCKPCIPKFQKNPAKYLVILREELEAQKADIKQNG